ncbi:glycosyltransferase family 4 protein [Pseudomonadota bacterium]
MHLAWRDRTYSKQIQRCRPNIYHETTMIGPRRRSSMPVVMTVYDLSLQRYPDLHPQDRASHFNRFFRQRLQNVDHVLTLSEFVRQEFIEIFSWPSDRVTAVALAVDAVFSPRPQESVSNLRLRYRLPEQYLLFVGAREPRKNLPQLLAAMKEMQNPLDLVCVGPTGWHAHEFERAIELLGLRPRIIVLESCADNELALLYSGAIALVYPSLYEGFGLPVLEAMACGCPVVCSDRGSLPEVVGSAAIQVSLLDTGSLVRALDQVTQDEHLGVDLRQRGLKRAAQFSWEDTARRTLAVFEHVSM